MTADLIENHVYTVAYSCRDIGYGVEEGAMEAIFRGNRDTWGKSEWQPTDGGPTLYLFDDEIVEAD